MLTPEEFTLASNQQFADNQFQYIRESTFRKFAATIRATFVAQAAANVPDYEPGRYYAAGFLIRHSFAGATPVFLAAGSEGYLPAPTAAAGDANWLAALSPASGPALSQAGTVSALRHAQNFWVPGRLYILFNRADAQGQPLPDVYVRAVAAGQLEPTGYTLDLHAIPQLPVPVHYDLGTDTTTPVRTASAYADLLGLPADSPALKAVLESLASATDAQKQRLDAILAGANGAVDTFIEAYNRFVANESAAGALNGQISGLQATQQQHTQQIGQNASAIGSLATLATTTKTSLVAAVNELVATKGDLTTQQQNTTNLDLLTAKLFGRNRGVWAANTAYLKYDFVTYQGAQYYANQAFTSGASFDASKWTAAPGAVAAPVSGRFRGITFLANTFFKVNDWFLYNDVALAAKTDFTTGPTFDSFDWKKAGARPGVGFDAETHVRQADYPNGIKIANKHAYFWDDASADTVCTLPDADPSGAYGLVFLLRNQLGSGKAVTLSFANGATVDGQASLTLAEGEWRQLTQIASPVRPGDFLTQLQGGAAGTSGGSASTLLYQAQVSDVATKYSDVVLRGVATLRIVELINTPGWLAQVINTTTGAAYAPIRSTVADINADIVAAFATSPAPTSVDFKIAPASITDTTRLAFILFQLSA